MTGKFTLFSLLSLLLVIISCKKNNDTPGNAGQLAGNYKFLYLTSQVQSTTQQSGGGLTEKIVTYTNYKTTQNTGTVTITKDSIFSKSVGYSSNTTVTSYVYENNKLTDSFYMPFNFNIPVSSTATKITVIGQDSIAFAGGYMVVGVGGGSTLAPPSGGRFSFKGDTLFITAKYNQTNPPQVSGGYTITGGASGFGMYALLRQ